MQMVLDENSWTMPDSFPDLSGAKTICVDVETRDEELKAKGPGVRRGAYVVGVAIGTDDGFRAYYPVAHDEGPNLNKTAVLRWLHDELSRPNQTKLGANILYDVDFLTAAGVPVEGPWYDVQIAEPLIDENRQGRYNLDALGEKYLRRKKNVSLLEDECKRRKLRGAVQNHLWRLPAHLVGPYAETDVDLPLAIFPKQKKLLDREDLWDLFLMETELLPMLLAMRRQGVRLDEGRLDASIAAFEKRLEAARKKLNRIAGGDVNYWAAASVGEAFDRLGIEYPLTPKTKAPSFTQPWLRSQEHEVAGLVLECRTLDKFIGTFLRGQMKNQMIDGRIHCLFNPLKSDEYGTVTGRFSSSHPNLQFIPIRDPELGPLCRSMFIPEDDCAWGKADYSQIEFRIFAHYAQGAGAERFRDEYRRNPRVDFHQWCADIAEIDRRPAKTMNFGIIYGMGVAKTAANLGYSVEEARAFLAKYHETLPFAKRTLFVASERAGRRGWIKTILNRRRRFDTWEPSDWEFSRKVPAVRSREKMIQIVREEIKRAKAAGEIPPNPGVRRAGLHKALNALIQGSAADLMKKAMVDCWKAGVFFGDGVVPHLTVHDEMDVSVPRTDLGNEAWIEMVRLMEKAIEFRVPVVVDAAMGPNWGEVK